MNEWKIYLLFLQETHNNSVKSKKGGRGCKIFDTESKIDGSIKKMWRIKGKWNHFRICLDDVDVGVSSVLTIVLGWPGGSDRARSGNWPSHTRRGDGGVAKHCRALHSLRSHKCLCCRCCCSWYRTILAHYCRLKRDKLIIHQHWVRSLTSRTQYFKKYIKIIYC